MSFRFPQRSGLVSKSILGMVRKGLHLTMNVMSQTCDPVKSFVMLIVSDLVDMTWDCINVDFAFIVNVSGTQNKFMPVFVIVTSFRLSPNVMFLWERTRL